MSDTKRDLPIAAMDLGDPQRAERQAAREQTHHYRARTLERLNTIERSWTTLVQGGFDEDHGQTLRREILTLSTESRVMGFTDVNLLGQRLQEVVSFAHANGYTVTDDLDTMMVMGLQFAEMLVRKEVGTHLGGIDLAGFARRLEDVLRAVHRMPVPDPIAANLPPSRTTASHDAVVFDQISEATQRQLAICATTAFIEHLRGDHISRTRWRNTWLALSDIVLGADGVPLRPLLADQMTSAAQRAAELGKRIRFELRVSDVHVPAEVVQVLQEALPPALDNVLVHGIEAPDERQALGKTPDGQLSIVVHRDSGSVELSVIDDGRGIDIERLAHVAKKAGLLGEGEWDRASSNTLLELLFHGGLSISPGRTTHAGKGLAGIRVALARCSGEAFLRQRNNGGTRLTMRLPRRTRELEVWYFSLPGVDWCCALPSHWSMTCTDPDPDIVVDSIGELLGLEDPSAPPRQIARFSLANMLLHLPTLSSPTLAQAERICPTPEEHPAEVTRIGGRDVLLLRPEYLPRKSQTGEWNEI